MSWIIANQMLAGLGLAAALMLNSPAWGQETVASEADAGSMPAASAQGVEAASAQGVEPVEPEASLENAAPSGEALEAIDPAAAVGQAPVAESGDESVREPSTGSEPALATRGSPLSGTAGSSLFSVALALVAVVLMILAMAWLIKRFAGFSPLNNRQIKVVASLSVGARERVVLVEVGGEQLLLGVTPQQINHLHTLKEPLTVSDKPATSDFAQRLQAILSKGRSE